MKKMILLLLAGFTFGTVSAQVKTQEAKTTKQAPATKEQRAEQFAGRLMKELGLTADQKSKVYVAKLEQITSREALDARYPDKEVRKNHIAEYKAVQATFDGKMKTILTPEQYTKWEAQKEKRAARVKARNQTK